jgi:hypothetical protein
MTAFEILTIVFYSIVVMIGYLICRGIATVIDNQQETDSNLRKMDAGLDKWLGAIANLIENKLVAIVNYTYDTKVSARELTDAVDKMHKNLCVEIADKMVNKMYPVNEGESLDAPFEQDYKLKKDIENKLNGFAAAVLDAECCPQEILDLWTERICESAHKFIKQFKIDWDKLSKEQQDEFLKRLIMPNYDSPFQPIYTPCYAPNGICSNPFGDCINCPKRGTGGTWSTSTNISKNDE